MSQQQQQLQQGQQFEQSVPQSVSRAVFDLEQFEKSAEWAKTQSFQYGDSLTAKHLEDLVELANVQKKLLIRGSPLAQTVSQCTQQALQQSTQQLQQARTPGVQQVVQQAQQLSQTITQASSQAVQIGQQQMGGSIQQSGGQMSQ